MPARSPSFADLLSSLDRERDRRVAHKLPSWEGVADLEIPTALALEQCSSGATAAYKAALVRDWCRAEAGPGLVTDLTCGLGADAWALSRVAGRVVAYEADPVLAAAAARNMVRLGAANVEVRCGRVGPESEDIPACDLIYADPARRGTGGKKVFLPEDCTPDLLPMLPMLQERAPRLLFKLSPMVDLSMLSVRLGASLREISVVSLGGEVKEVLCLLERAWCGEYSIRAVELAPDGGVTGEFVFTRNAEMEAQPDHFSGPAASLVGQVLLEPSSVLLKAGAFKLPCGRWGLCKLAPSTHLYLSSVPALEACTSLPAALFRTWRIREALPFGKAALKELSARYPRCEVTARNLPLSSDALRARLGVRSGGDVHLFGCGTTAGPVLMVCELSDK
mgnify:CR=1 FL=1